METERPAERALLVGVQLKEQRGSWDLEESLVELGQLARTAGLEVVGRTWQRMNRYNSSTLIGKGKLQELLDLRTDLGCDLVIFDDELSPRHLRNLEAALGDDLRILDRTSLILDVFAQHARTREGQLQVELAQYEYRLPRLTRAWTHLARQAGGGAARGGSGGVGLRGPGETQLEVDRRDVSHRISQLKAELEEVRRHRQLHRQQRKRTAVPVVAIVGYTNAGKSTLLNALTGADVLVEDKLFATLDPTTRKVTLPGGRHVLLSDTVGFIQKLPTDLVAAFRATLEEINEADLILHVVDASHPQALQQSETVMETLADLGVEDQPVVVALNKIDRLPTAEVAPGLLAEFPDSLPISAIRGIGLPALLERIEEVLLEGLIYITVQLPFERGELSALFHQQGTVVSQAHTGEGVTLEGYIPRRWLEQFRPYLV